MRLTKRDGNKVWFAHGRPRGFLCPRDFCDNAYECDNVKDRTCPYLRILDKLAAYEDAEEQGRPVILPCKVGDSVFRYSHVEQRIQFLKCEGFLFNGISWKVRCTDVIPSWVGNQKRHFYIAASSFGKTVFLTREEAEAALKGETEDV